MGWGGDDGRDEKAGVGRAAELFAIGVMLALGAVCAVLLVARYGGGA